MANDAAPALIEALTRSDIDERFLSAAAAHLNVAADQLAKDNAAAARRAENGLEAALKHYVQHPICYVHGGFCNLVGSISTLAEKLADEQPEDSQAERDYLFAAEVMDAALAAVDLNYGERSSKRGREEALAKLRELVAEIKP